MPKFYVTPVSVDNSASLNNISSSAYARLDVPNLFTSGSHIISQTSTTDTQLTLKAATSQTSFLLEYQNPSGTSVGRVGSLGQLRVGTNIPLTGVGVNLDGIGATGIAFVARGASGQTANLQQWQDSTPTTLAFVDNAGGIYAPVFGPVNQTGGYISTANSSPVRVITNASATQALVVRGAVSQTANLQEWQNSSGTILSRIDQYGQWNGTYLNIASDSSTNLLLRIRATSGQTADLTQWQNSASTVLASISSSGALLASSATFTGSVNLGPSIATGSVQFATSASSAASATWAVNAGSATYATSASLLNGATASVFSRLDSNNAFTSSMSLTGSLFVSGNVVYNQSTNSSSITAYSLVLSDSGKFVEMTSSAANTITVPAASAVAWVVGTRIDIIQYGAGQTTISPASGVTVNYYSPSSAATRTIKARYGAATLVYRAANEWLLIGNLT